jgi:hypothetical protein
VSTRHNRWSVLAALFSALLIASCSTGDPGRVTRNDPYPYWKKGAGAAEAAGFMKIQVPEGATEVKGAVQVNPQEDSYILTFRTDSATAARIAKDLRSEDPPAPWRSSFSPKRERFRHLGLAEPQTLKAPSGQARRQDKEERQRFERAPQLILPNGEGMGYIRLLGRLTRLRAVAGPSAVDPSLPALGKWLTWFAERVEHCGVLQAMSRRLAAH